MKITTRFSGSIVTSLDSINGWSIQTLLRGENDSKQTDEIQASLYTQCHFLLPATLAINVNLSVKCNTQSIMLCFICAAQLNF